MGWTTMSCHVTYSYIDQKNRLWYADKVAALRMGARQSRSLENGGYLSRKRLPLKGSILPENLIGPGFLELSV